MSEIAIVIYGRGFTAGIVARKGFVVERAPILRKFIPHGATGAEVAAICKQRGWTWARATLPDEVGAAKDHPAVAAVLAAFPGAEVVGVRKVTPGAAIRQSPMIAGTPGAALMASP